MVAVQAALAGGLGFGIGVGLAAAFDRAVQGGELVSRMTPDLLLVALAAVLGIVGAVTALGAWRAVRVEPARVFRS
jgi:ABC-type antimicrobial peptide transport system permease subunit